MAMFFPSSCLDLHKAYRRLVADFELEEIVTWSRPCVALPSTWPCPYLTVQQGFSPENMLGTELFSQKEII